MQLCNDKLLVILIKHNSFTNVLSKQLIIHGFVKQRDSNQIILNWLLTLITKMEIFTCLKIKVYYLPHTLLRCDQSDFLKVPVIFNFDIFKNKQSGNLNFSSGMRLKYWWLVGFFFYITIFESQVWI